MKRILIIEDNDVVRENTAEILELAGYEVLCAPDGKAGVATATEQGVDLILCDIMMPELDGYGVLHILRDHPKTATTPFVFLTAKAEQRDFRAGMDMGAEDYITKPFEDKDLLNAIAMRLKKHERLQQPAAEVASTTSQQGSLNALIEDPANRLKFEARDLIYREGQNARSFYFIINGKVKLSRETHRAKDFVVDLCGPGAFFGHTAITSGGQYTERAEAMEACDLVRISIEALNTLQQPAGELNQALLQQLFQQTIAQESRLIQTAFGNLRERIAYQLCALQKDESSERFITMSREELAAYVGIASESLIRTLSDFKSEGLIAVDGRRIEVKDLSGLKAIANYPDRS